MGRWNQLTGRPAHGAPAQKVEMQVKNRLTGARAGVDDDAESVGDFQFAGERGGHPVQMAYQRLVGRIGVERRSKMLARNNQQVHGRLRVDVVKGEAGIIGIGDFGGDLPVHDFAEDAGCRSVGFHDVQ